MPITTLSPAISGAPAVGDSFTGFERYQGSSLGDTLIGSSGADTLAGGHGLQDGVGHGGGAGGGRSMRDCRKPPGHRGQTGPPAPLSPAGQGLSTGRS